MESTVRLAYQAVLRREPDEVGLTTYGSALRDGRDLAWLVGVLRDSGEFQAMKAAAAARVEFTVRLAYQAVLRREPDEAGLAAYGSALRDGHDLVWLVGALRDSGEFQAMKARREALTAEPTASSQVEPAHLLSHEPPMQIDAGCSDAELQELWDHVARTWSRLGEQEPHWSVLTQGQFRVEVLGDEQLAAFYRSGDFEVARLNAWVRRGGLTVHAGAVCAEFGCGVGRITHSLARQYARVTAFDVSAPHLRTAREWMDVEDVRNVEFVHVTGKHSLAALREVDVFYSIIALQHSPPPIILDVLEHAFAALRPGGYAFFQLPTFSTDYRYSASEHLGRLAGGTNAQGSGPDEMEVHFVPQCTVLEVAHRAGLRVVEIQPDISAGNLDRWISNTFLLVRP